ncbi:lecithin retinol acyltransferase-like [Fundulus heteroclitus]|uniref:lecithin retinol acyltransferase-like n=1 Tax=Fundulus heteroclitus TaxID=8078 RepID=UPI00165BE562|nr:lecithin retinol acyltransferase-like [Fundulus heteroclitus]XP_035991292.1 lecithin retinol acyltransferase-like [Fundulus heteroclitus]
MFMPDIDCLKNEEANLVDRILLLMITTLEMSGFQFGDIICYKTRCNVGVRYKHFAVYVGDVQICGKEAWQDIFEQSKKYHGKSCIFAKLKTYDEPEVNNYLDDYTDPLTGETYGKGDDEDIIARITETYESCSVYGSLHNNCEHLATYVRYGVRIAVQFNMTFEGLIFGNDKFDKKHLLDYLRKKSKCPEDHNN